MKKSALKCLAAGAILTALLLSTACSGNQGNRAGKDKFIVVSGGSPSALDPIMANDWSSSEVNRQIYSTLVTLSFDTLEVQPSLAERYQFENDENGAPTRIRFFLKQGVKFHNGEEMKASDVKFSIDRARVAPLISYITGAIGGVEVINDYEVLVLLKFPFAPILNNLAHPAVAITNEKAVTEGGSEYARNPIGTGPMKFVNWIAGDRIELTRWDDYFGEAPKVKDLTIRYILDPSTALLEIETGGADMLLSVQPQDVPRIEANPKLHLHRARGLMVQHLGFNVRKAPFNDLRVRQAILHAVDTDAIVQNMFAGVGAPARGPLTTTIWASAADQLPKYEFDPDKASKLLSEAGYPNGFSSRITTFDNPIYRDYATIIKRMLARVNIIVDIDVGESAAIAQVLNVGGHEMFIANWGTVTGDPDYGLEIFHTRSHGAPGNRSFYSNQTVDRMLDAGRMETNLERREQIYFDAQHLIHSEAPWLYLWENEYLIATNSAVKGFQVNPLGHQWLWTVYFE